MGKKEIKEFIVIGVVLQAICLAISSLLVGIPLGFFQLELSTAIGPLLLELLSQFLSAFSTFLVCAAFAFFQPRKSLWAAIMSLVVLDLLMRALDLVIGGTERPAILLWLSLAVVVLSVLLGATAGCALSGRMSRHSAEVGR